MINMTVLATCKDQPEKKSDEQSERRENERRRSRILFTVSP